MKKLLASMFVLATVNVFASQEIYYALDVEEQVLATSKIELKYKKEVQGLTCFKVKYIRVGSKFSCEMTTEDFNSEYIYKILNVREETVAAPRTQLIYTKTAGQLKCVKINDIRLGSETFYNCKLKF